MTHTKNCWDEIKPIFPSIELRKNVLEDKNVMIFRQLFTLL